jgi:predicted esterase
MNLSQFTKAFCFLFLLIQMIASGQSQTARVTTAGTKFWLYTPPAYTPSTPTPILVCLHGGNEIGDDLNELTANTPHLIPSKLISQGLWPASRPFIVVTPQLKRDPSIPNFNDQEWPATLIDEVIEYVRSNYNVDANRIYLTGISLGAAGGWDYITAYPGKVAAFVPFSGKTRTENACIVKNTPVWAFHGEIDALVRPQFSVDMINAINACSPAGQYKVRLNLLHAKAHEGWSEVYNDTQGYDIYNWLLKFVKGNNSNKAPYVNAGIDQKILLQATTLTLTGDYFDSDGTITNVTWTKTSGPAVTLDQSNPPYLKLTGLTAGNYQFELRVKDNAGVESADLVALNVVNAIGAEAAVTSIVLVNSKNNNAELGNLTEGMVINKTALGTDEFNFKAVVNGATVSIRFRVGSDQHTSTTNSPGPYYLKKATQSWPMPNGDYVICATPYKQTGARGAAGISLLYKVTVTGSAIASQTFYSKPGSNISQLSSWGINTDGTGTAPTSFTANNQTFNIANTVTVGSALAISGTNSSLVVKGTGQLTINANLTTTLNTEGNAIVNIFTNATPTIGSISATSTINYYGSSTIPSGTYGTLALKGSGSTKTLSSTTTTVVGNFTIDSGVTVNGSSNTLTVGGNITNSGTFSAGTSTVKLNGITDQSISGPITFNKLTINKSGSNVTLTGTGPTTITSTLTLTARNIISSSTNKLTLSSGATIIGGSSSSYLSGPIVKTIASGGTFSFPLGSISPAQYRPTTLASTSVTDTWTVEYLARDPSTDGYPHTSYNNTNLSSVSQFEYWNVSRLASASASLTLAYNTGSYTPPNMGDLSSLRIAHWEGTRWDRPAGGGTVSQAGSNTNGTVTVTNITSFSPVTFGVDDTPLPVKWRAFTATRSNSEINLFWQTAQEINNNHFEIERSVDGNLFTTTGQKEAVGNSNVIQRYQFTDLEVLDHITYYYRIKQIDNDGQFDFSDILAVPAVGKLKGRWHIWPNPVGNDQSLQIELIDRSADANRAIKAKVIRPDGTVVYQIENTLSKLTSQLTNVFERISPGIYIIQISDQNYQENFRLVRL